MERPQSSIEQKPVIARCQIEFINGVDLKIFRRDKQGRNVDKISRKISFGPRPVKKDAVDFRGSRMSPGRSRAIEKIPVFKIRFAGRKNRCPKKKIPFQAELACKFVLQNRSRINLRSKARFSVAGFPVEMQVKIDRAFVKVRKKVALKLE